MKGEHSFWRILQFILIPVVSALMIWMWKLDDRQFKFSTEYVTKVDFIDFKRDLREDLQGMKAEIMAAIKEKK